jgi:hypothetical protein
MRDGRRATLLTVVVTCTLLLSGCGQERSEISDQVARTLQRDVVAVKSAVDESRWEEARAALDRLEADVANADASGNLSDDRAARIQTIRQRVLEDLDRIQESEPGAQPSATSGAESTPTSEPKVSESAEPDDDDNPSGEEDRGKDKGGHNKGKGEGQGHGKS